MLSNSQSWEEMKIERVSERERERNVFQGVETIIIKSQLRAPGETVVLGGSSVREGPDYYFFRSLALILFFVLVCLVLIPHPPFSPPHQSSLSSW